MAGRQSPFQQQQPYNYYGRTPTPQDNDTYGGGYSPLPLPPTTTPPPQYPSSPNMFASQSQHSSTNSLEKNGGEERPKVTHDDGWQFRYPEYGHIITKGEMINRIIPFYEMFITNVVLLGYRVLVDAHKAVTDSTIHVVLYEACTDRWHIEDFDFCAASRLVWGLIGGAVVYFIFTTLIAIGIGIELGRKGYYVTFTALWHSPFFAFCIFFPETRCVDVLSIPNKFVGLSMWTRGHIHRIALAIYCLVCTALLVTSLRNGTAEAARIRGESLKGYKKYYNPYLIPYYVALYIFVKTLVGMIFEIFQDKEHRNKSERVGRYYLAIKPHSD